MSSRTRWVGISISAMTTLLSLGASADTTTAVLLHDFHGEAEVTISTDGRSSQFIEVPFSTFVRLTNDPFVGDPDVIVAGSETSLTFDFDFDEAAGSNDKFSAVLFSAGPNGGPFKGKLTRYSVNMSHAGTVSFDLAPYVGQTLGLEFELLDLGGDDTTSSSVTVSNLNLVSVPEPSQGWLLVGGLLWLLALARKKATEFAGV
jgi:hypothetical protein